MFKTKICSIFVLLTLGASVARQATFGGRHTIRKLDAIEKYLRAYQTVMKRQSFTTYFFDAFAGTGDLSHPAGPANIFGGEIGRTSFRGRVRPTRAAGVVPSFDRYIFVEQMKGKAAELLQLKSDFSGLHSGYRVPSTVTRTPK